MSKLKVSDFHITKGSGVDSVISVDLNSDNSAIAFKSFQEDKAKQYELLTKGYTEGKAEMGGNKYTAELLDFNTDKRRQQQSEHIAHIEERIKKGQEARARYNNSADTTDDLTKINDKNEMINEILADAYESYKNNSFGKFVEKYMQRFDNSTDAPFGMGGIEYVAPSLLKMMGKMYYQKVEIGTTTKVDGVMKNFTINDYITEENMLQSAWTPYMGYLVRKNQTIFNSYDEIRNAMSDMPGQQAPNSSIGNNELLLDARGVKNMSIDQSLNYNLMSVQSLNGYFGLDLIAEKQQQIMEGFSRFHHYSGMESLYNAPFWKNVKASKITTTGAKNTDILISLGLLDNSGMVKNTFKSIVMGTKADIETFRNGLKDIVENSYGNNSMENAVLLVPKTVFDAWTSPVIGTQNNLSPLQGFPTFKSFIEYNINVEVCPANEIEQARRGANKLNKLSLLADANRPTDMETVMLYSKEQVQRIITKPFSQFNTWGTADGCTFTTIYSGQLTQVFNPFFKDGMNADTANIPAWKIELFDTTIA